MSLITTTTKTSNKCNNKNKNSHNNDITLQALNDKSTKLHELNNNNNNYKSNNTNIPNVFSQQKKHNKNSTIVNKNNNNQDAVLFVWSLVAERIINVDIWCSERCLELFLSVVA